MILGGQEFVIDRDYKEGILLYNINDFSQTVHLVISEIELILERIDGSSQSRHFGTLSELADVLRQGGGQGIKCNLN